MMLNMIVYATFVYKWTGCPFSMEFSSSLNNVSNTVSGEQPSASVLCSTSAGIPDVPSIEVGSVPLLLATKVPQHASVSVEDGTIAFVVHSVQTDKHGELTASKKRHSKDCSDEKKLPKTLAIS